jgi:hypothetical protein
MIAAILFVYLFVGVVWVLVDFNRPPSEQPLYVRNGQGQVEKGIVIFGIVLWPIRLLFRL